MTLFCKQLTPTKPFVGAVNELLIVQSADTALEQVMLPEWVVHMKEDGSREEMNMSVFWPEATLKEHNVPYESEELVKHCFKCTVYKGLWRNSVHGKPSGTINKIEYTDVKSQHAKTKTSVLKRPKRSIVSGK